MTTATEATGLGLVQDDPSASGRRHHVVEVRATGITPEAVAVRMQDILDEHDRDGWTLRQIQPIIYNSSTTGYLLLIFERDTPVAQG